MKRPKKIIVAVTGASGSVYARLLLESLCDETAVAHIAVIFSDSGQKVAEYELQEVIPRKEKIMMMDNHDMFAAPASGSAGYDAMVVIPCSMGTLGRIASGTSSDLISRAADVMLKERRNLILVPREAPLSTIHLRNMAALSECGALILPASPSFYSRPTDMTALCRTVTDRVMSQLGFDNGGYIWGETDPGPNDSER